jgi:hypothetical protein
LIVGYALQCELRSYRAITNGSAVERRGVEHETPGLALNSGSLHEFPMLLHLQSLPQRKLTS